VGERRRNSGGKLHAYVQISEISAVELDLHAVQRHVETQPIIHGGGQEPSKPETDGNMRGE